MKRRNLNNDKPSFFKKEEWREVVGFPDYQVSSFGRIRSIRPRKGSRALVDGGILKGWKRRQGSGRVEAVRIALRKNGKTYEDRIHRIVLAAFIGPCPKGMEGCHNDGDPENNHVSNLRWDTHRSNMNDQYKHDTKTNPPILKGESNPNTHLTKADVVEIRKAKIKRGTKADLARKYNTTITTISRIIDRKTWRHVA